MVAAGAGPVDPRFGRTRRGDTASDAREGGDSVLAPVIPLRSPATRLASDTPSSSESDSVSGAAPVAAGDDDGADRTGDLRSDGWAIPGIDYSEVRDRATDGRRGNHPAGSGLPSGAARPGSRTESRAQSRAQNVSMSALTRRGASRRELEKTLLARELDLSVVQAELERLEGVGLIDDRALAETIVRTQHERKGLGRSALVAELRRRLIDPEHIDAALEQLDGDDELETASSLAERRARQLTSLDRETAVRRLTGYLLRKGYGSSVTRAAVDRALSGHGRGSSGGVRFR